MKSLTRDYRIVIVGFGVLFLGLALLVGFYVAAEARKARILFEYEADRIAAGLLDAYRATGTLDAGSLDPRIEAFGVFRPTGEAAVGFGTIPATLDPQEAARAFRYDPAAATLTLVRPLGMGAELLQGPGRIGSPGGGMGGAMAGAGGRGLGMMGAGRSGTLFLRLNAGPYFRARRMYGAATLLAPLAVAGLAAGFLFLVSSNIRYRRRSEEQATLARLGESARTLAHEIRNPLGAIRMQTALLRRQGVGDAHQLDVIDEEVERLNTLSRRVGDFLRSPGGAPERIMLGDYVRELARKSPYPLTLPPHMPDAAVSFDRALLRSVLENLTRNAYESYDDIPGERSIEVGLARDGGRAILTVSDRGKGVPDALRERAFDPFFTDKIHGSGIGLPLSRRFVEAAGGTLTLAARDGGGTEARVTLPVREDR